MPRFAGLAADWRTGAPHERAPRARRAAAAVLHALRCTVRRSKYGRGPPEVDVQKMLPSTRAGNRCGYPERLRATPASLAGRYLKRFGPLDASLGSQPTPADAQIQMA